MKTRGKIDDWENALGVHGGGDMHPEQVDIKRKPVPEMEVDSSGIKPTGPHRSVHNAL